jgi:ethanolamine ammonia-lyase small subunit
MRRNAFGVFLDMHSLNDLPALIESIRDRTPARILVGRSGGAYRTQTQLALREDHAAARDAVRAELDLVRDLGSLVEPFQLFEVQSQAESKDEYLRFPQRGRGLSESAKAEITSRCPAGADVQVIIGDGLSATAVASQVPDLLPRLADECRERGWSFGQPFVVRYCRVGILNDVGEILKPAVAVLLIGERPGLATAESLSAYLAYRPQPGHTDAHRNLISNIHPRGVPPAEAAARILNLALQMRQAETSGVAIKEQSLPAFQAPPASLGE